jgi:hypothetical protein
VLPTKSRSVLETSFLKIAVGSTTIFSYSNLSIYLVVSRALYVTRKNGLPEPHSQKENGVGHLAHAVSVVELRG